MRGEKKTATRPDSLIWAERAADRRTHKERMDYIDNNVPASHHALVRDLMVCFLPTHVLALPDKESRRAYLLDIPLDCDPSWARSMVECQVQHLWKQRKTSS